MNIVVNTPQLMVAEWRPQTTHLISAGGALAGACLMYFSKDALQAVFWFGLICILGSCWLFFSRGLTQQWVFNREKNELLVLRKRPYFGAQESTFPLESVRGVELRVYQPTGRTLSPEEDTRSPRYALFIQIGDQPPVAMHSGKLTAAAGLEDTARRLNQFLKASAAS